MTYGTHGECHVHFYLLHPTSQKEWCNIPLHSSQDLYHSFARRIKTVLMAKGLILHPASPISTFLPGTDFLDLTEKANYQYDIPPTSNCRLKQ